MLKILSVILIVMSTSLYGQYKANGLISQHKKAEAIKKFFIFVRSNINFNRKPIVEILYEIKKNKLFPEIPFLYLIYEDIKNGSSFKSSMQNRIENEKLNLTPSMVNILNDFAKGFGKSDIHGESNNIEFLDKILIDEIQEIKENKNKNAKVYVSVGFFVGIAISIFII